MKRRLTRVVVPVIGLLAVTGALALVAMAPVVLFSPSNDAGPLPSAPAASSEVARVTAPSFRPQRPASGATENGTLEATEGTSAGGVLAVNTPVGGVGGASAGKTTAPRTVARAGSPAAEEPAAPAHPAKTQSKHNGNGKAKGHYKGKAHGKAKGHSK